MKKRTFFAAALLLIAALAQVLCAIQYSAINRELPHAAELRGDTGLTMAQTAAFEAISVNRYGARSAEFQATVSFESRDVSSSAAYCSPKYGISLPFVFTSGAWLTGDGQAVLPEAVAKVLFDSAVTEGNSIAIEGKNYTVAGVYADRSLSTVFISDSGIDAPAAALLLVERDSEEEPRHAGQLLELAAKISGVELRGELRDYRELIALAQSLWLLSAVLCALVALVFVLIIASRLIYGAVLARGEQLHRRALRFAFAAIITSAALLCFSLILGKLRIPGAFLPPDNIFDLAFYHAEAAAFFAHAGQFPFEARFAARIVPLSLSVAVSVVAFCAGAVVMYRTRSTKRR
ncbi:MAG: ABC transporter permease [Oscillospiraceae bacterium]|jgi:hypothetical protein|nr:ABC transporter permease [Oscillospiraceae bacterium]